MTRNCAVAFFAIMAALVFCAPAQSQIDIRGAMDPYRGVNNQRQSSGNSNQSSTQTTQDQSQTSAQTAQDKSRAAAFGSNEKGRAAYSKGDWATADAEFRKAMATFPDEPRYRRNLADAQDREGSDAYDKGDYSTAAGFFRQAVANFPPNDAFSEVLRKRLAAAEQMEAAVQREGEQRQKDKVTVSKMQQDIQALAQSLTAAANVAPSPGKLGFMASAAGPSATTATAALDFGDPMVVNASGVPTGLPNSVAAEIPDTPAGNRVRKGFEAIVDHDWNVAHAWFQDALYHDPGNAGIERLIGLAEYTMEREKHPLAPPRTAPPDTNARGTAAIATADKYLASRMDADLARALDDFNRNYLPKHPELTKPLPARDASPRTAQPAEANWTAFFDTLFRQLTNTSSASGVRN